VGGATSGDDDGASSYSGTELHIKKEADEWHQGAGFDNVTQTNATGRYVTASGRVSRRSTSSSVMSDDSLDSMIGAQHNHTYPSQSRPTEPRVATARMRAAATTTAEEDEENAMTSRDVKRLHEMHIPLRYDDIVSTPVEKFNRLLQNHHLSDAQVQFIRDVRRRGKNKMAAQNCRKRKLDVINDLDGEVVMLQQRRMELQREQALIAHRADDIKMKMRELEEAIMRSLNPGSRQVQDSVRLQLTSDGALYVVPATNSSLTDENQSNNNSRKKKGSKKQ
jgi:nuclear factor erythroid 2-related factor 1/3